MSLSSVSLNKYGFSRLLNLHRVRQGKRQDVF